MRWEFRLIVERKTDRLYQVYFGLDTTVGWGLGGYSRSGYSRTSHGLRFLKLFIAFPEY